MRKDKIINHHIFSSVWSNIKVEILIIRDNSSWLLGNCYSIRFWFDTWCGETLHIGLGNVTVSYRLRVSSFIIDGKWNFLSANGLI